MKKSITSLTALALGLIANAQTVDFNSGSDLGTFFNTQAGAFTVPTPNTGGLGGTGSISTPDSYSTTGTSVYTTSFAGDSSSFDISLYFQFVAPTADASFGSGFYVGFGPNATYSAGLGNGGSDSHFLVGFQGRTTTGATSGNPITKYALFLQEKEAGTVSNTSFTTLTNDLVVGEWYHFDMSFT